MTNQRCLDTDAVRTIEESIRRHVTYSLGKAWSELSAKDLFTAVALSVRDRLVERMLETEERYRRATPKSLAYLSIEFLLGQSLGNNLINLGIREQYRQAVQNLGGDLAEIEASEDDAALGNGGLGRLAACFLDSLASLDMPGYGYGIHYEYGLFRQEIDNGDQREKPDNWLANGTPWEISYPEEACLIPIYGRIEHTLDRAGGYNPMWVDWKLLVGIPHDVFIPGYGGKTVNRLRLYAARASRDFDMQIFNDGDYFKAVEQKISSETISKVLYPSDAVVAGRELRLMQEYFLVACAIRDIVSRYEKQHASLSSVGAKGRVSEFQTFADKVAIQLNDTHPALAVAELMRFFVDEKDVPWEEAWKVTQACVGFTNHTLAPEALEKWPVALLETVLPRHMQIIQEINRRFLERISTDYPGESERLQRMSLIDESAPKQVRMSHLAIVGSHSINGVSALHTELIKTVLVPDFAELWPERFNNKTNGITQRRWLLKANPLLADLIRSTIGDGWVSDLCQLRSLEPWVADANFQDSFQQIKRANKEQLTRLIAEIMSVKVDPDSLFDIQVKRIHSYKRQLLNVMHIIDDYLALVDENRPPEVPRTFVFAGKAAPGYWAAKQLIKLVHRVARVVNTDPRANDWIKVVFLPDYRVSLAEKIIPAADLSEQISTAGKEASGTSNMKFALNGAVTMGTLDGANIEILHEVGPENIFIFGLTAKDVQELRTRRAHHPVEYYRRSQRIQRVVDSFADGRFSRHEPGLFTWIKDTLLDEHDDYFHLADFESYVEQQARASQAYADRRGWTQMAILNVARIGKFSSDRTVQEYARDIWGLKSV
jgi:starch phosphorylase